MGMCIVEVEYPGCTTFEGRKLLVLNCWLSEAAKLNRLDPHFTKDGLVIARFLPTDRGLWMARAAMKAVR